MNKKLTKEQKQPAKYFLRYFVALLTKAGDNELLGQTSYFITDKVLTFNCRTLAVWEKLLPYQQLIDPKIKKQVGLIEVTCRPHPHCVVYHILAQFEKAGLTEVNLAQVLEELAAYHGNYPLATIREVLRELTVDYYQEPKHLTKFVDWLVPLRKEAPALERLKTNHYRLFRRQPPAPKQKGKGKANVNSVKKR